VLPSSDNNNHRFHQQTRSRPSKEPGCDEVIFFLTNLFRTRVATVRQKELSLVFLFSSSISLNVCIIAKTLFVLTKKVDLHYGG
jgi:hypothetical protein